MKARFPSVLAVLLSGLVACATHAPSGRNQSAPAAEVQISAHFNPYIAGCVATEIATAAAIESHAWERVRLQTLNRSTSADERARDLAQLSAQENLSVFVGPGVSVASILPRNSRRQSVLNDRSLRALVASMDGEQSVSGEDRTRILVAISAAVASEYAELSRAHEEAFLLVLKRVEGKDLKRLAGESGSPVTSSPDLAAFYSLQFRIGYENPSPRCRAKAAS